MTELGMDACEVCGRVVMESGEAKRLEAAFDRDDTHQAVEFLLGQLKNRRKRDRVYDMLVRLEEYCGSGKLAIPEEFNHLREDVWEIKRHNLRLPLYTASERLSRATHGFVKQTEKTPRQEIDRAFGIKKEDGKRCQCTSE